MALGSCLTRHSGGCPGSRVNLQGWPDEDRVVALADGADPRVVGVREAALLRGHGGELVERPLGAPGDEGDQHAALAWPGDQGGVDRAPGHEDERTRADVDDLLAEQERERAVE